MTFKVQKTENTGIVYAIPSSPNTTFRIKHSAQAKTVSGAQTTNQVTEFIINDESPITIGDSVVNDALSIRLRVSGSILSTARKQVLLDALSASLENWSTTEDSVQLKGFNPTAAPVDPADLP